MSVNIAGGSKESYKNQKFMTVARANRLFVNESGDSMKGPLNMKNNKIIGVGEPTEETDVTNKKYIDTEVNNIKMEMTKLYAQIFVFAAQIDANMIRYIKYKIILDTLSPKFWVSGYNPPVIPMIGTSKFSQDLINRFSEFPENPNKSILFKKRSYVVSDYEFGQNYTFIGITKRLTPGRVFTSFTGNKYFGYWRDKINVAWHDGQVLPPVSGAAGGSGAGAITKWSNLSSSDGAIVFVYISEDNRKFLYNNNVLVFDNELRFTPKNTTWGKLVLGDVMFGEGAEFQLYECLGFDRVLHNDEIEYIINIIK